MVALGRQGPWHPRGQGLLVAVVALSVVALLGHGLMARDPTNGAGKLAWIDEATTPWPAPTSRAVSGSAR